MYHPTQTVYPARLDYVAPDSIAEAIGILSARGGGAKVLAGGQSLIPLLKLRFAAPEVLVDIGRIPGLSFVRGDRALSVGARTSHAEMEASETLRERCPVFTDAAGVIADPLVRNLGTIGGSVVHGDPAGDWSAVVLALDAEARVTGPRGERTVEAEDFLLGPFTPAIEPDELLTEIRVPAPRVTSAYEKLMRKTGDFATVGVAVSLRVVDGRLEEPRVALTAVGPRPFRSREAEGALAGAAPTEESFSRAGHAAAMECEPVADARGSVPYKREMVRVHVRRALRRALGRDAERRDTSADRADR